MKLVSINNKLFEKFKDDKEILKKSNRPYVLVLRLRYREQDYNFAVPIRSNIPAAEQKKHYFGLPPRHSTKAKNRHGIHYIKMFPVTNDYLVRYRTENNPSAMLIQSIIDRNTASIVTACQSYLDDYAAGIHPSFSTNIDYLIRKLYE